MTNHRECPGSGFPDCFGVTLSWRHSLCSNCLERFGGERKEWPDWLHTRASGIQNEINRDRRHDELEYFDEYPDEGAFSSPSMRSPALSTRGVYNFLSASDDDPADRGTIGGQHYDAGMGWGPYSDYD